MTSMYRRQQQHDRQRSEWSYHGSWGYDSNPQRRRPKETERERRWYGILLVCLTALNVAILVRVLFILWKQFNL